PAHGRAHERRVSRRRRKRRPGRGGGSAARASRGRVRAGDRCARWKAWRSRLRVRDAQGGNFSFRGRNSFICEAPMRQFSRSALPAYRRGLRIHRHDRERQGAEDEAAGACVEGTRPLSGRAVVILALASFASASALRAVDPLLPLLAETFGTTAGGASAVITAFSVAYGVLQVVNGPLSERIGKYRMVFWVTAISAAGYLACAFAPSLPLLVAARFATGATVGAIVPLSIAWIGDVVPYDRRQPVLARFLIGNMLGLALGTTASGLLGELFGWRAIFFALTGLYVLTAALLWLELQINP